MLPDKPGDWPACFTQHLNAGELDAVMDLRTGGAIRDAFR